MVTTAAAVTILIAVGLVLAGTYFEAPNWGGPVLAILHGRPV